MATTTPSSNLITLAGSSRAIALPSTATAAFALSRRRKMTQEKGRAVEMLGHAIEYLGDELSLERPTCLPVEPLWRHPQIEAIQLLMARNREVYMSCPEVPSLHDRLNELLTLAGFRKAHRSV
jgi:hypothetical protein